MTAPNRQQSQSGFTLVELIVSIVVIAVAVTGVLLAVQFTTMHSADPMIRQQAVAIADAYMEEIMLQRYKDPDGDNDEPRSKFDDVYDYNDVNNEEPRDQTNSTMPGLENYRVDVQVENATSDSSTPGRLGPSGEKLDQSAKITVTVTHQSADVEFSLTGFKTQY
jgi:MSHA pilin protein MshD